MHKILFTHPLVGSYSAFLFLGILSGYVLARWRAVRAGIKGAHIDNVTLLIAVLSLFGARLFSWLFYFPPGANLWKALWDPAGGMVFYGGLTFGLLALIIYTRLARLPMAKMLDVFAPGLALGLAFGRIGCFMAGCCWGDVCVEKADLLHLPATITAWQIHTIPPLSRGGFPLAVRFPEHAGAFEQHRRLELISPDATRSLPVHPVQLYEAVLAFALCIFLHRFTPRIRWDGQVCCLLLVGYGLIRLLTEFFRADNSPIYLGLTLSQVISLILICAGCVIWAFFGRAKHSRIERATVISSLSSGKLAVRHGFEP